MNKITRLSKNEIRNYKAFENLSDEELEKILDFLYDLADIGLKEYTKQNIDK